MTLILRKKTEILVDYKNFSIINKSIESQDVMDDAFQAVKPPAIQLKQVFEIL